jgi:hypothetical protein
LSICIPPRSGPARGRVSKPSTLINNSPYIIQNTLYKRHYDGLKKIPESYKVFIFFIGFLDIYQTFLSFFTGFYIGDLGHIWFVENLENKVWVLTIGRFGDIMV